MAEGDFPCAESKAEGGVRLESDFPRAGSVITKFAINLAVAEVALMAVGNFPLAGAAIMTPRAGSVIVKNEVAGSAIMTQTINLALAGFMHTVQGDFPRARSVVVRTLCRTLLL